MRIKRQARTARIRLQERCVEQVQKTRDREDREVGCGGDLSIASEDPYVKKDQACYRDDPTEPFAPPSNREPQEHTAREEREADHLVPSWPHAFLTSEQERKDEQETCNAQDMRRPFYNRIHAVSPE